MTGIMTRINSDLKIEIIGAGAGGLLTAYRLKQSKIADVHVNEARSRVGGRLLSSPNQCELGAWSLGDGGNPETIQRIAIELGLETTVTLLPWKRSFWSDGEFIDRALAFEQAFSQDKVRIKDCIKRLATSSDTLQEVLDEFFKDNPLIKRYFSSTIAIYQGSPLNQLSAKIYEEATTELLLGGLSEVYKSTEEGLPLLRVKGGNDQLVKKLAEKLWDKISFNKVLVSIRKIPESHKLQLNFSDGTSKETEIVVLALPISAYSTLEIDEDLIPQKQLEAIKQVRPGTVSKILLPNGGKKIEGAILSDDFGAIMAEGDQYITIFWHKPFDMESCVLQITQLAQKLKLPIPSAFIRVEDSPVQYPKDVALVVDWPRTAYTNGSYSAYPHQLDEWVKIEQINGQEVQALFKPAGNIYFVNDAAPVHASAGCVGAAFESAEIVAQLIINRSQI